MQKHIEFGQTINESSVLFTTEECLAHLYALELLEQSISDPEVMEWAQLESGASRYGAEQWVWDRCDILRADLKSAANRFGRNYADYTFNDDDSGFLGYALNRLAQAQPDKLTETAPGLVSVIPIARYVLGNCLETFSSAPIPIQR